MADFQANGGKIEISEFHTPDDFVKVREKTLINATGYGSRALFGDESVTPVRGQLARMIIPDRAEAELAVNTIAGLYTAAGKALPASASSM